MSTNHLPPTQELILEVLAARMRLGESEWMFGVRCKSSLNKLEQAGLVQWKQRIEDGLSAWLTTEGKEMMLSPIAHYNLENRVQQLEHQVKRMQEALPDPYPWNAN